ncbi:hypothetical protein KR018_000022 [Drosophila ironensis]|nr:hypothetical protein KR018_000022 [Drosophila ironensis]
MSFGNVICTICFERYHTTDNIHAGSCGHAFHEDCLDRWREQSRTCPICRCNVSAYIQIYLNFEDPAETAVSCQLGHAGTSNCQNQRQGHLSGGVESSNNSNSSLVDISGIMREYENLLYESGIYQEEIKYLNAQIGVLTHANTQLKRVLNESDSD